MFGKLDWSAIPFDQPIPLITSIVLVLVILFQPGGIKSITLEKLLQKAPERAIEKAVKGMLPGGPLGYAQFRKLKVYAGAEHPHTAQQPQPLNI